MSEKVSIAQALRRIKKLKGQIAEHTQRARSGVSYVSTAVPAFRYEEEMVARTAAKREMLSLESRVAVANATNTVQDGSETVSVAEAIRRLQELKDDVSFFQSLHLVSGTTQSRQQEWNDEKATYINRLVEITHISDLTEKQVDQHIKEAQNHFEALNNAVEEANHTVLV